MATQRDRIVDYLRTHPAGVDDDVLASALGISPRQAVNQVCRQLVNQGVVTRQRDSVAGKIVNRLSGILAERTETLAPPPPPAPAVIPVVPGRVVPLHGAAAVLEFAYPGELGLTEDQVKEAIKAVLEADGWTVDMRWGHAPGIDIDARRGPERLVVEAKGEGSLSAMRVNYFLGALGELLQRMDSPDTSYGLALPAHRQFARLIMRLPQWVRARLDLQFFLVRNAPGGGYEVGRIQPGGEGDGR